MTDTVPRIWNDDTCVVIGSGPSLSLEQIAHVSLAHARGQVKAIAVNDNYLAAPWADALYACDFNFWKWHFEFGAVEFFDGLKVTIDEAAKQRWPQLVRLIGDKQAPGLSVNPGWLHCGKNSGYQAVNLAYLLGARRVLLIGFDQKYVGNRQHYFKNRDYQTSSWYESWQPYWQSVADAQDVLGLEVINCTPDSALMCFPMERLHRCLPN